MPYSEVRLRRWQVVASFALVVVVSVILVLLNDLRTDRAIKRSNTALIASTTALARTAANAEVNRRQDVIRRELVEIFCEQINAVNERIRATVRVQPRAQYAETLRRLNSNITEEQIDALFAQAKEQELEVHERFSGRNCAELPGG